MTVLVTGARGTSAGPCWRGWRRPAAPAGVRKVFLYAHPEGAAEFAAAAQKAGVEPVRLEEVDVDTLHAVPEIRGGTAR